VWALEPGRAAFGSVVFVLAVFQLLVAWVLPLLYIHYSIM
jgi:hypothetical protein